MESELEIDHTRLHLLKALVHLVAQGICSPLHLLKVLINLLKALINLLKALVHLAAQLAQFIQDHGQLFAACERFHKPLVNHRLEFWTAFQQVG